VRKTISLFGILSVKQTADRTVSAITFWSKYVITEKLDKIHVDLNFVINSCELCTTLVRLDVY